MKYGSFRYVNVDKDKGEFVTTDDWHCPLLASNEEQGDDSIRQGLPALPCRRFSTTSGNHIESCTFCYDIVTYRQEWLPAEKQELLYYCRCTWPTPKKIPQYQLVPRISCRQELDCNKPQIVDPPNTYVTTYTRFPDHVHCPTSHHDAGSFSQISASW